MLLLRKVMYLKVGTQISTVQAIAFQQIQHTHLNLQKTLMYLQSLLKLQVQ